MAFQSKSIFDSPSPPRASSPSLSLFGSPQPQSANAYEAAEARTFFISLKDRVVYVPPRTTQTQPSTTSHTMSGPPPLPKVVASAVQAEEKAPTTFDPRPAPSSGFGTSVSSTTNPETPEQWRNRLLGGPSTLTIMRREREAKARHGGGPGGQYQASVEGVSGGTSASAGFIKGGLFSSSPSPPRASGPWPSEGTSAECSLFGEGDGQASSASKEEGHFDAKITKSEDRSWGRAPTTANSEPAPTYGVSGRDHVAGDFAKTDENTHAKVARDIRVLEDQAVDFGSDIVIIIIREAPRIQSFILHTNFLTARSAYFKSALLRSPDQNIFNFPKHDPRAFALYFQLIYTGRLLSKTADVDEYTLLCKLYILARKFVDIAAQNAALDAIIAKAEESGEIPAAEHVWIIYRDTDGRCGGKRLMLDFYTYKATGEWMKARGEVEHNFAREFLAELALSLVELRTVPEGKTIGSGTKYREL